MPMRTGLLFLSPVLTLVASWTYPCCRRNRITSVGRPLPSRVLFLSNSWDAETDHDEDENELLDRQVEALLDYDEEEKTDNSKSLPAVERAWRYVRKPLLRIGSKGAHFTHGNSLRQLLESHTAVKVKVNTRKYGTLEDAFQVLKELTEEAGAPQGIELIQARDGEKTILFGMPGTLEKIERGEFPPPERPT